MEIPQVISQLLMPTTKKPQGRKSWGIDLETVWLPFFTASNAIGKTQISTADIGCPLRLGYDKSGAVRFSQSGRPLVKVAKGITEQVGMVRGNMIAAIQDFTNTVVENNLDDYKAQIELNRQAGEPIYQNDKAQLAEAVANNLAIAKIEADAKLKAEAVARTEAVAVAKTEARTEAEVKNGKVKELVTA